MFAPQTAVPMTDLNRLVLIPATFIQFWAGGRFYRAAWRAARHGTTNMDTLVAVGTTRCLGVQRAWSRIWPGLVESAGIEPVTYFDSSTIIIGLVLLGRWLEARAKGRTTGAIHRLVGPQPDDGPDRARRRPTTRSRSRPSRSATSCASGPATGSRSTASSSRAGRRSTHRC